MRKNMISFCALLLAGAASMLTAGAQNSGKPKLAVFVVGMSDNNLGNSLATQVGSDLNRNSRYDVLSGTSDPVKTKLNELRTQNASSIDRNALAEWGLDNGVSTICLVIDDIKGNDHMFSAQLIDTKDSKLSGKGSYVRTGVSNGDLARVSLALVQQLNGAGRKLRASTPARSYPAELDIEMVRVEGGTFTIGCNGTTDGACHTADNREKPTRSIKVSSFHIGKYEVTRAQWLAVIPAGHPLVSFGNSKSDDQLPIENVSRRDIDTAFLPRLNKLTGKTYRLATSAEWEYAARGCKAGSCDAYMYSGSNDLNEVGWYNVNSNRTYPVGQKKPNGLGIYDMSGNAWEWCSDWGDANYYLNTLKDGDVDPKGPASGTNGMFRGGGYSSANTACRVAHRNFFAPNDRHIALGFRLVLSAQ
jgi:formylglycine-generating enzyme required for sulfatase activity